MNNITISAIFVAAGLFAIIWVFLAHMILSQAPDTHLQFYVGLMDEQEGLSGAIPARELSPSLPNSPVSKALHRRAMAMAAPQRLREVPLLLTTSLRGRGL